MIIPCIDFQGGKVVQLIQGREKALEGEAPLTMLEKFAAFGVIQVIDLDAAMNRGENNAMVEDLAGRAKTRVGGGVRTVERAQELIEAGASSAWNEEIVSVDVTVEGGMVYLVVVGSDGPSTSATNTIGVYGIAEAEFARATR